MRLTRAERAVILLMLLFIVFAGGVHMGMRQSDGGVTISVNDTPTPTAQSATSNSGETAQAEERSDEETPVAGTDKVNINTADAEALSRLDGVGEVLARRIVEYREANGAFASPEEITNVYGIGSGIFERIQDSIRVG